MNRICLLAFVTLTLLAGCVAPGEAVGYARRAHPECDSFRSVSHSYSSGSETPGSQTEVSMECEGAARSITVKCIHGFGIVSDTTCHENN